MINKFVQQWIHTKNYATKRKERLREGQTRGNTQRRKAGKRMIQTFNIPEILHVSNTLVLRQSFKQFRMFCQTVVLHLPLLFTYLCHWSQPCKPFFCKLPLVTFDIITLKSISNIVRPFLWSNEICQKKYPVLLNALFWCSLTAVYCKLRGHIDLPKYAKYFQYIQYTFI